VAAIFLARWSTAMASSAAPGLRDCRERTSRSSSPRQPRNGANLILPQINAPRPLRGGIIHRGRAAPFPAHRSQPKSRETTEIRRLKVSCRSWPDQASLPDRKCDRPSSNARSACACRRPNCATTEQSENSTMPWMIDCGCTKNVDLIGRQRTVRGFYDFEPLFIIEAESM